MEFTPDTSHLHHPRLAAVPEPISAFSPFPANSAGGTGSSAALYAYRTTGADLPCWLNCCRLLRLMRQNHIPKTNAKNSARPPITMPAMAPPDKRGEEFGADVGVCERDKREVVGVVEGRPMRPRSEVELVADERADEDSFWKLSTGLIQLSTRGFDSAAL